VERHLAGEGQGETRAAEDGAVLPDRHFRPHARVVERRLATHLEGHAPAHDLDPPDDLVRAAGDRRGAADRHEVLDLAHAVGGEEAGEQDVGVTSATVRMLPITPWSSIRP